MVDSISRIAYALDSAKNLTYEAAAAASSKFGETSYTHFSKNITPAQLKEYLNSKYTQEVKDGMNKLIMLLASGETSIDIESYFPDVVKNINSEDWKIRKMICVLLLRFAERNPNLALLCVNSLQKTLNDVHADVRAYSVRALADVKIASLHPIIWLTVKKAVADSSASVRSEVAFAVMKLYRQNPEDFKDESLELLISLLADSDPQVISAAILVFSECFTENLELLHSHFRYYCEIIYHMDSWSQSILINILVKYCKKFLPRPTVVNTSFETDDPETILLPEEFGEISFTDYSVSNDEDLQLFLSSLPKLIFSNNATVLLSLVNAIYNLGTIRDFINMGLPQALIRSSMASDDPSIKNSILSTILLISKRTPGPFESYYKKFFLLHNNMSSTSSLKLQILTTLINNSNAITITKELKYYVKKSKNSLVVINAIKALEVCAQISSAFESHILKWLIDLILDMPFPPSCMDCLINTIRGFIQLAPKKHLRTTLKLSNLLETNDLLPDNARAGIIWLFGEIASVEFDICPDVLHKLVRNFGEEESASRLQILLLAAKLLSYDIDKSKQGNPEADSYDFGASRIYQMYNTVVYLAKFDDDYDIRDRARWITSLIDSHQYELATLMLQAPKPRHGNQDISDMNTIVNHYSTVKYEEWPETPVPTEEDIRKPGQLKDYRKFQKHFSSNSFISQHASDTFASNSSSAMQSPVSKTSNNAFTTSSGKKYTLQGLDEFFADVKPRTKPKKKKIIIQEVSSSEEESSSNEEYEEQGDDASNGEEDDEEESSDESESSDEI